MRTLLLSLAVAIVAPGCATEYPPIGQLQTSDHLVVVHSGPDGLLYSIKTHEGILLEHQKTEQWIAAEFPAIHETLVKGIAKLKTADAQARDDGASAVRQPAIQVDRLE